MAAQLLILLLAAQLLSLPRMSDYVNPAASAASSRASSSSLHDFTRVLAGTVLAVTIRVGMLWAMKKGV